eukprot:Clim_evm2s189 gene=Clim_evmTU2s189
MNTKAFAIIFGGAAGVAVVNAVPVKTSGFTGTVTDDETVFGSVIVNNPDLTIAGHINTGVKIYEENNYNWPSNGSTNMTYSTSTPEECKLTNQTMTIKFPKGKGEATFVVDYEYDGYGCSTRFVDAYKQDGPNGSAISDDVIVVMSHYEDSSIPTTYIQTCTEDEFMEDLACGNIPANFYAGGINVPSHIPTTGQVSATNVDATPGGYVSLTNALIYSEISYTWPNQGEFNFSTPPMPIRAQEALCKSFTEEQIEITIQDNGGSIYFDVYYDWVLDGCVPIFTDASIKNGNDGTSPLPDDVVIVITKPVKVDGVPTVYISDCSTEEFTQNSGCPNAPIDIVAGGLNLPPQ